PGDALCPYTTLFRSLALAHGQRGRELDDRVSTVVGAAVQTALVHLRRHEVLENPLGLLLGERLLGVLVLDELDSVEEALTADVTDRKSTRLNSSHVS